MSKGKSQPVPDTQTVVQSNLPEYARPYFERMMGRAEAATNQPYELYGGPRIADFNSDQMDSFSMTRAGAMAGMPALQMGQGLSAMAAGGLSQPGYQAGQFSADFNPSQFTTPDLRDPSANPALGVGAGSVMNPMAANLPNLNAGQVNANSIAGMAGQVQAGQIGGVQNFGQSQADQYMSPFLNRVLDAQRGRMQQRFDEQTLQRQGEAARAGIFGGYRQGVQQAMAERNFNEQLDTAEAAALQNAFENAQQQFERDRTAGLGARRFDIEQDVGAQRANQEVGLRGLMSDQESGLRAALANQSTGLSAQQAELDAAMRRLGLGVEADVSRSQLGQRADEANQSADMRLRELGLERDVQAGQFRQAAERSRDDSRRAFTQLGLSGFQANEGARQQGEQLRLERLRQLLGSGTTLADLGRASQDQFFRGAQGLQQIGSQRQQREQASLDLARQDFEDQRNYERNMINFLSGILRGVPVSPTATTSQYANPNPYSQALGLGISGLALQNMFGGGGR